MFGIFDMAKKAPSRGSKIYKLISKHLLQSKLPQDEDGILDVINDFKDLCQNTAVYGWVTKYCEGIFRHILNHSSHTAKVSKTLFQDYGFFRKISFAFAKLDMIDYINQQPNFPAKEKHLKNIESWKEEATSKSFSPGGTHLLESFYKNMDSRPEDYLDHHKFIAAFFLVFPTKENHLKESIERGYSYHHQEVEKLMGIWSRVYPDGVVPDATFGEYKWMLLVKNPAWLERVMLHQIATQLKIAMGPCIMDLVNVLATGPWSSNYIGFSASVQYKKVIDNLQVADAGIVADVVYELSLKLVYHLIRFKSGCDNGFSGISNPSKEIRTIIYNAIETFTKMRKAHPPVKGNLPASTPGFDHFLYTVSDILDSGKLDHTQEKMMIKQVTEQLKFKPQDFHLIISGQPFKFEFSEPLEADVSNQKDATSVLDIDQKGSGPDHTQYILKTPQRPSGSKIANLAKYFIWKYIPPYSAGFESVKTL
ncbi:uncharacterized protein MELLADRAFT_114758 [Melampsora larici-populina 98AG31]|uniref:Uncharacterized protein n=1 Tax=Melampsora larici-populina (strain 98AG31 / pathotype 3-4-7) TaxID=747676 RepID=F4SEN2_MELLP|nr:uncharacterized protein MELLADRAFT_114758 [Melampsora larici-populina 98AG31]EGF96894.1 hypothetical protein MELLADRAFT_114758 [Melampsora larici-populina 98AG31]